MRQRMGHCDVGGQDGQRRPAVPIHCHRHIFFDGNGRGHWSVACCNDAHRSACVCLFMHTELSITEIYVSYTSTD